eukprot:COSAG04_NODE_780_length_10315_cov_3.685033_8_plen_263_part_00
MVAASNFPATPDIWPDQRQAVANRTASFHFDTLPPSPDSSLDMQLAAPEQLGKTLVLLVRLYKRLKGFAGTNGFQMWTSSLDYFAEQFDQQRLANNYLLRFLLLEQGENCSREATWWFTFDAEAETSVAELKRKFQNWSNYSEGRRSPDLTSPFTAQNLTTTLRVASAQMGGKLQLIDPKPRNMYVCAHCSQEMLNKSSGERVCSTNNGQGCVAYQADPRHRRTKRADPNGGQKRIKGLKYCQAELPGRGSSGFGNSGPVGA